MSYMFNFCRCSGEVRRPTLRVCDSSQVLIVRVDCRHEDVDSTGDVLYYELHEYRI